MLTYGEKPKVPGLYLGLYHGFPDDEARQEAQDWGAHGPLIGPLQWAHITYMCDVKLQFVDETTRPEGDFESATDWGYADMKMDGDCVRYGDMSYGDIDLAYYPGT